jgi:mono/diheme cytochrome c family protein
MKGKLIMTIAVIFLLTAGFTLNQTKPWPVPDKAAKAANPVKSTPESISEGKALWSQHCASCHGKTGKGDGNKAAQLKTQPVDFSGAEFQSQSDGSMYYRTAEGRDDMPAFKKKIPDADELWSLVNFMRTLKK